MQVPEGVDAEDAVFARFCALSALCYHKAHFVTGECVAVVGLEVLGMGAHETLLSDDPDLQVKIDQWTGSEGIDLVILTANPCPAYCTVVEVVRDGRRVSIVALPRRGEAPFYYNPLDMRWFYAKGTSLIANC